MLQKTTHESYHNRSKNEKVKKWGCGCEQNKSVPDHEKQTLVEYRKNTIKYWKTKWLYK